MSILTFTLKSSYDGKFCVYFTTVFLKKPINGHELLQNKIAV